MEKSVNIFRFKQFSVVNERSAMKVNTDGVLLGALMTINPDDRNLLDIGTGTGTIALMAAQRLTECGNSHASGCYAEGHCGADEQSMPTLSCYTPCHATARHIHEQNEATPRAIHIDAIDIDEPSASEAAANFRNSPWRDMLHAHHTSLDDFAAGVINQGNGHETAPSDRAEGYDLIFSNPPYFDNSLQAPEERRNAARHTSTGLSYREILDFAAKHLSSEGRVAMVIPADTEQDLTRYARMSGLHLQKLTRIRTVPRKAPSRIVAEFSRQRTDIKEDTVLTIHDGGRYTPEYLELMQDFYLFA